MTRKRRFIIRRNTWRLHQFEFSVDCSYADCIERMKKFDAELQRAHLLGLSLIPSSSMKVDSKSEPYLRFIDFDETATSFELFWNNIVVSGTVQSLTEESALFVGLSQFIEDFPDPILFSVFTIPLLFIGLGVGVILVFILLAAASAYVSPDQVSKYALYIDGKGVILGISIVLAGVIIYYLRSRWQIERAVKLLMDIFRNCSDQRVNDA
jgi:hypothetical protein